MPSLFVFRLDFYFQNFTDSFLHDLLPYCPCFCLSNFHALTLCLLSPYMTLLRTSGPHLTMLLTSSRLVSLSCGSESPLGACTRGRGPAIILRGGTLSVSLCTNFRGAGEDTALQCGGRGLGWVLCHAASKLSSQVIHFLLQLRSLTVMCRATNV